jgi:hypothetical protein
VSGYVRRHLFLIAGATLLVLGWSYRLDALGLLHEGTGALGAVSAVDHRVAIPANLALAIGAMAMAILVAWTGWIGQTRVAFIALTVMLVAALSVRQLVPAIGGRLVSAENQDAQEQSYREIRNAYTRRAYGVDRVERAGPEASAPSFDDVLRGASLWDSEALRRVIGNPRAGARPNGSLAWQEQDGRLVAFALEQPLGPEAADLAPPWTLVRVAADVTDDRGGPLTREDLDMGPGPLRGILVHDSAFSYYVLHDTADRVRARPLDSFVSRLGHAWHLQNPSLLRQPPGEPAARLLYRRDVRDRVQALYPFFEQASRLTPVVFRDSVYWALHLYASSNWYPLSLPLQLGSEPVRYVQHAAVAIVNAHTGAVSAIPIAEGGPLARTWLTRFPELFSAPSQWEPEFLTRLPPPWDGAVVLSRALAHAGLRGEFDTRAHLPPQGTDSSFAVTDTPPWIDRTSGTLAFSIPLLGPTEDLRGLVVAHGGPAFVMQWMRDSVPGARWSRITSDLQGASDSLRNVARGTRSLAGAVRVLPSRDGFVAVQTHYVTRPDGTPQVLMAGVRRNGGVVVGRSLMEAAGLPDPVVADAPLTPEEFRRRVGSLYEAMRDAMRRADWTGIGAAWEALGRLLRAPRQP